jgi:hypothetical protein
MATVHSTSKTRSGRNRVSKHRAGAPSRRHQTKQARGKCQTAEQANAIPLQGRLREFLDSEHGFLLKAQSLLLCIAHSMDDSTHPITGPYYPDVIEFASDLLRRRARNLDQLLLDGRLPEVLGNAPYLDLTDRLC